MSSFFTLACRDKGYLWGHNRIVAKTPAASTSAALATAAICSGVVHEASINRIISMPSCAFNLPFLIVRIEARLAYMAFVLDQTLPNVVMTTDDPTDEEEGGAEDPTSPALEDVSSVSDTDGSEELNEDDPY